MNPDKIKNISSFEVTNNISGKKEKKAGFLSKLSKYAKPNNQIGSKISSGFLISIAAMLLAFFYNLFYMQFIEESISPMFFILLGLVFSFSVFGALYTFSNSYTEMEEQANRLKKKLEDEQGRFEYLNRIVLQPSLPPEKIYEQALEITTKTFASEIGLIVKINGNNYTILAAKGMDKYFKTQDEIIEFAKTCCGISFYTNEAVLINNVSKSIFKNHPCHVNYRIESYVGTSITENDKKIGAMTVFSTKSKESPFTQADNDFIQIVSKIISMNLEHKSWYEKIKKNNEEAEWLNKIKIGRELRMIELKREIVKLKKELGYK